MASNNKQNHRNGNRSESRVERLFKMLLKAEEINPNKYNFDKITFYTCQGYDLIGSSCNTHDSRRHFLVTNNHYEVWELPKRSNKGLRMTGDYMVLFRNVDFGCWYLAEMKHKFIKNSKSIIEEKVSYHCYGEFKISEDPATQKFSSHCTVGEDLCCRGVRSKVFDSFNVRKETGYHTTMNVIYRSFGLKLL